MRTGIKSGMTNSGMSNLLFLEPRLTADPKAPIKLSTGVPRKRENIRFSHVSKYICKNIESISKTKRFEISKKYQFLDNIFLRVLNENPGMMPDIFFKMFKSSPKTVIKFLSNKSNFLEDLSIIMKMPKWTFVKALFN